MKIQLKTQELIIFESALYRTTTTLINGEQYIALIDPNWLPLELDFIANLIQNIGKNKKKYLIFTHSDYDHIIGYGQFKNYKTIASTSFVNNEEKEAILNQIRKFDDEYYINRTYPIEYPHIEIPIEKNAESLHIGSDKYIFYQAKGHNKDGLMIHNVSKGILVVGDYLSNIEFPYIYFSLKSYKETLSQLKNIIHLKTIATLVPGHGDFTTKKKEMKKRIEESKNYLLDLEYSIIKQKAFDKNKLFTRYKFPRIMTQFHENNILLIKKEMGIS